LFFEVSAQNGYNLGPAIKGMLTGLVEWEDVDQPGTFGRTPKDKRKVIDEEREPDLSNLNENLELSPNLDSMTWWMEDIKPENTTAGLLGKQRKEGCKSYEGSYRSYYSAPILDVVNDDGRGGPKNISKSAGGSSAETGGKKGCCGGGK